VTIFYCLRFESSLFVASYDWQAHGGGIRPRIHTVSVLLTVLCRLKREHPVEPFNFRYSDATTASVFVTAETDTSSNSVITELCVLIVDVA
jgi:hypothetical protein